MEDNSQATTWKFSLQLHTREPSAEMLDLPQSLKDEPLFIFGVWQHEKWDDTQLSFIKGFLKFSKSRSYLQVRRLFPETKLFTHRGSFREDHIDAFLKLFNTIGVRYTYGNPQFISLKRKMNTCNNTCRCCKLNKIQKLLHTSFPSADEISSDEESIN